MAVIKGDIIIPKSIRPHDRIEHYSNSSMSTFRRCTYRYQHFYGVAKEDRPVESKNKGQRLGSAGHMALKAFYMGESIITALDWAWEEFDVKDATDSSDFGGLEQALTAYWKTAMQDRWKVIFVEKEVRVGRLMAIIDLLIQTPSGQRFIVDHKFQKTQSFSHLDVDPQANLYLYLARLLEFDVDGFMLNIIPTGGNAVPPKRKVVFRTDDFLDNLGTDIALQIRLMDEFYANPTPYRNFTADCKWGCPIYDKCLKSMEEPIDGRKIDQYP